MHGDEPTSKQTSNRVILEQACSWPVWEGSLLQKFCQLNQDMKHCQRHNGPEGWVHITASDTNFDQISISETRLKLKIFTKPSFRISTKIQLGFNNQHNLYKTSVGKNWSNSSFKSCLNINVKILTEPCAQRLNKSLTLWPNLSFQICSTLLPIRSSSSTLTTSTSFELASSHARVTSIKFSKQDGVRELVSHQWVS